MKEYLDLPEARKRIVCEQAQDSLGLPPVAIEKDFWVCWTRNKLFMLTGWHDRLTFKGGTSQSSRRR